MQKFIKYFSIFFLTTCFSGYLMQFIRTQKLIDLEVSLVCGFIAFSIFLYPRMYIKRVQKEHAVAIENVVSIPFSNDKTVRVGLAKFVVDDTNKQFMIKRIGSKKIYNYSDLLDYELYQDDDSITKGKGLATAVGGLTFGLLGAMVGSSGKRKNKSTCISMGVNVTVNNLLNPVERFKLITAEVKKSSPAYLGAKTKAEELIATLQYIDNQNK